MTNDQFNDEHYLELIQKGLQERHGVDFSLYRKGTVRRRLSRRMAATNSENYRAYFHVLEKDPEEYARLLRYLTIKVSRFFRNSPVFEILSDEILPDIMKAKKSRNDKTLRIWCPGCAFGEEAYSVAITLVEYFETRLEKIEDLNVSIFGTDIDEDALDRAGFGMYDSEGVKEVKKGILDTYFTPIEGVKLRSQAGFTYDANYQVIESIRNLVNFSKHDLTSETKKSPPAGVIANYDLVLCRNVLAYFSQPLQKTAFSNLFNSLDPGGYLILGRSETIPKDLDPFFIPQNPRYKVYKKRGSG